MVDKDAYWLEVSRYVVLNRVRAGLVKEPGSWRRESLWSELKHQIFLGDERFVGRMQARADDEEMEDVNIPRAQRRGPAPPLKLIEHQYKERNRAVVGAYETGDYSYQQIGKHFGVHFTTVGRIVRETRKSQREIGCKR